MAKGRTTSPMNTSGSSPHANFGPFHGIYLRGGPHPSHASHSPWHTVDTLCITTKKTDHMPLGVVEYETNPHPRDPQYLA